jgi:hypothetical protein
MVRLQQQTIMPFIRQQQLHMPPASIVQRFCTMLQAILSSQEQMIFMPPVHFSILIVPRGTIIQLVAAGIPVEVPMLGPPMPGTLIPGIPIPVRSIIMLDILHTPFQNFGSYRKGETIPPGLPANPFGLRRNYKKRSCRLQR